MCLKAILNKASGLVAILFLGCVVLISTGCSSPAVSPSATATWRAIDIVYATSQADHTRQVAELSKVPPSPTPGGTITPSGPLFATAQANIVQLFAKEPQTVAGFALDDPYRSGQAYNFPVGLGVITPSGEYAIVFSFDDSAHTAYLQYLAAMKQMPDGQAVMIGDGASVSSNGKRYVAALHYRNIFLTIRTPQEWQYNTKTPPPARLTDEQLIAILNDVYSQILKQ